MLTVYVKDLVVEAKHGVHPHEKQMPQRFVFNVEVTVDTRATVSDNLADTLNYSELKNIIVETAQNHSFELIERLAEEVAKVILANTHVLAVIVSIDKPEVFKNGVPGVRLSRSKA